LAVAPTVSQSSNAITQAIAPAFLLAALAAFVALLIARLNRIILVIPEPYPVYTTDSFPKLHNEWVLNA
jgi:hypothetical protein